jgi:hypothetical protein
MNPPYGPYTGQWLKRLAAHGNGIALVFARTDVSWFHQNAVLADAMLFKAGRISFCQSNGKPGPSAPGAASLFLAYGDLAVERLAATSIPGLFIQGRPRIGI